VPIGTKVFDWMSFEEWNVTEAYVLIYYSEIIGKHKLYLLNTAFQENGHFAIDNNTLKTMLGSEASLTGVCVCLEINYGNTLIGIWYTLKAICASIWNVAPSTARV